MKKLLIDNPSETENKMIKGGFDSIKMNVNKVLIALVIVIVLTLIGCGVKGKAVVIVQENGLFNFSGMLHPLGNGNFDFWEPGIIYLFRKSDELGGVSAKPGEVYQVINGRKLKKVGNFDMSKNDEDLYKQFLSTKY